MTTRNKKIAFAMKLAAKNRDGNIDKNMRNGNLDVASG